VYDCAATGRLCERFVVWFTFIGRKRGRGVRNVWRRSEETRKEGYDSEVRMTEDTLGSL